MKLCMFIKGNKTYAGLMDGEMIHVLPYKDLNALIIAFEGKKLSEMSLKESAIGQENLEKVRLISPVPYPRRHILCVGKNYRAHAEELKGKTAAFKGIPELPIYFSKGTYHTLGHQEALAYSRSVTQALDYEAELAVIIGQEVKNLSEDQAMAAIFGYCVANDFSARDLQVNHQQWFRGKSLDDFTALGPWIVTQEEIRDPYNLEVTCHVNGQRRQVGFTKDLIFSLPRLISELSTGMTLLPGDIILTGTPSGVGMGFDPPKYLSDGDEVVCEIKGIGQLATKVVPHGN